MSWLFTSGGQRFGASVSASVPPMNIQDWFPLGLTGLISCCPRDPQESSPALQFKSISSWVLSLLYGPTLTRIYDYWKNHSFDYTDLCWQSDISDFQFTKFVIAFLPRSKCLLISWLQSNYWKCNTWLLWVGMTELQYTIARTVVLSYLSMSLVSLWLFQASYGPYFQIFCFSQSRLLTLLLKAELSHTSFTTPTWPHSPKLSCLFLTTPSLSPTNTHHGSPWKPPPLPLGRGPEISDSFPQQSRPWLRRSALISQVIISKAFSHAIIVTIFS